MIVPIYYFGPIDYWSFLIKEKAIVFEKEDNFQKETYRNRTYIYGPQGRLILSIPIKHESKRKYKEQCICYDYPWQKQHFRSLKIAYQNSCYFEFYEHEFYSIFRKKEKFLIDFNYKCISLIFSLLNIEKSLDFTEFYKKTYEKDLRHSFIPRESTIAPPPAYHQVFYEKKGFIQNLSILDLIFNKGKESIDYLNNI